MTDFASPFDVLEPARLATPLVFNSPHSGRHYPPSFLDMSRLDPQALRRSEDIFVDRLFADVVSFGAPLMQAHFPRAYLDVNREPYELDPRMFEGRLPSYANTRSLRVAGGLGTIARIVGDAQEIYARRMPVAEAMRRIDTLYKPYHQRLRRLMQRSQREFGVVLLIDCHSMPSASLAEGGGPRADIVLGDRYGTSCAPYLTETVEAALRAAGLHVVRNKPYAGGFITEHYGNPLSGVQVLQLEINRSLYVDETSLLPTGNFESVKTLLTGIFADIAALPPVHFHIQRSAAE